MNVQLGQFDKDKYKEFDMHEVNVDSLKQASEICMEYRNAHDLGASTDMSGKVTENGNDIARVSYNGRVWDLEDNEIIVGGER